MDDVPSIDFGDYSFSPNRRVAAIGEDYKGPGLNKIPGRIQTVNPYVRDELASASFSNFPQRRPQPASPKSSSNDCDFYTDDICLDVRSYPT